MAKLTNDQKADAMEQLANLYRLQAILGRMQKNLSLINSSPNAQVITEVNPNLFKLAVKYYGDANQWTQIAEANNVIDPMLSGIQTLIIPPLSPIKSGGLLNA